MATNKLSLELVLKAADLFAGDEEIYSSPIDYPKPDPITYYAYDLGTAAVDAMLISGFSPNDIKSDLALREQLEEEVKEVVSDWREISARRIFNAFLLNSYSPHGSFNPN
jgi:hypothetical protein